MSLNGNLEDLPLLDILQIVSFSRKTGYLTIRTPAGEGAIVFRDGFVVSSFAWDSPSLDPASRSLPVAEHQKLVKKRIGQALEQLIRLREGQFSFSLAEAPPAVVGRRDISHEILIDGINAQELLLDLARGMDEDRRDSTAALEASFAEPGPEVGEGAPGSGAPESFADVASVHIEEIPESVDESELRDDAEAAPLGAGEQADLARPEASEAEDELESLLSGTAVSPGPPAVAAPVRTDAPAASPVSVAPSEPTPGRAAGAGGALPGGLRTVLVVDDEPEILQVLAARFRDAGFAVVEAADPEAAVKIAGRLGKDRTPFILVTDLGMPTSGGTSFQGGFEIVKRIVKMNLRPPVLLMAESLSSTVQSRARQLGITTFVFKPGLSKLDPEQFEADLEAFAHKIVADILPRLARPPLAPPAIDAPPVPVATPLIAPAGPSDDLARHFTILQQCLDELRKPQDASQISMLVMRTAREFFERGILLLVKNDELRGLGGFGRGAGGENLNLLVREVRIPLLERSPFSEVVTARKPYSGLLAEGQWTAYLFGKIGRFQTTTVALLPLLTNRETVAVLYGDNPETGRDPGRLDALAVFMNQAGIALENAFLQRKVATVTAPE